MGLGTHLAWELLGRFPDGDLNRITSKLIKRSHPATAGE
jgi:hypothetical protein